MIQWRSLFLSLAIWSFGVIPAIAAIPQITVAGNTILAIRIDGSLWGKGYNPTGMLGNGTTDDAVAFTRSGIDADWKLVSSGTRHTIALKADNSLWTWGDNMYGQLGTGDTIDQSSPVQIGAIGDWKTISASSSRSYAIKSDGTLWAWGYGRNNYLGNNVYADQLLPVQLGTDTNWATVSAGPNHAFAIKTDGSLWGWGSGTSGKLGYNSTTNAYFPTRIGTENDWDTVVCGTSHSLALKTDGSLWAWGSDTYGQLGDVATHTSQLVPLRIGTDTNWTQISAGSGNSAGRKSDGSIWVWGHNYYGQVGDGTTINRPTPVQIGAGESWDLVYAGYCTVAVTSTGKVMYWGETELTVPAPKQVNTETDWSAIDGAWNHFIAVKSGGTLWGWGENWSSEIDDSFDSIYTPLQIGTDSDWLTPKTGGWHNIISKTDGSLWGWGSNWYGQQGDGTYNDVVLPQEFLPGTGWISFSGGDVHTVAVRSDGTLWGWGDNDNGKLGDGTTTPALSPIQIGTDNQWRIVAAGAEHTLGIKADGTLWGWGYDGDLSFTSSINTTTPQQIGSDNDWALISAGSSFSMAIKTDGTLWGWGNNAWGAVGDGTGQNLYAPTQVGSDNNWQKVVCGFNHTLAIKTDGTLWAWGENYNTNLGTGDGQDRLSPVRIGRSSDWSDIAAGFYISMALKRNGTLWGWGYNNAGELGMGENKETTPRETGFFVKDVPLHSLNLLTIGDGDVFPDPGSLQWVAADSATAIHGESLNLLLAPSANSGSTFTGWSGDCSGTGDCTLLFDGAKSATATFAQETYTATPSVTGNGTITPDIPQNFSYGDPLAFDLAPAPGYQIGTVSGCGGTLAGTTYSIGPVAGNCTVTATFVPDIVPLLVSVAGPGTVNSTPVPDITCTGSCSQDYELSTLVTLTATPDPGAAFGGWSGACSGAADCVLTMDAAKSVTAVFTFPPCLPPGQVNLPLSNSSGIAYMSWGASGTAGVFYTVERSPDGGNSWLSVASGISGRSLMVSFNSSGTYQFRVKSTHGIQSDSPWSYSPSISVNLVVGSISGITVPATNTTGSYQVSWSKSSTPDVTYTLWENGSPLYTGTNNYLWISGKTNGTYSYSVQASKTGFADSAVTGAKSSTVTLKVANLSGIYTPATNTTGSYQVSWSKSSTPGVTYTLWENGSPLYTGTNNYLQVSGRGSGNYSYSVQATKSGFVSSAVTGPKSCTVSLKTGNIAGIYLPSTNTTGSYQVSWSKSSTPDVTYTLWENGSPIYTGTSNYLWISGKANGTYSYSLQASKTGFADSAVTGAKSSTVTLKVANPGGIYTPSTNSTGSYHVSWSKSSTPSVTYTLWENGSPIYTGTSNYFWISGRTNGSYSYTVQATRSGYMPSSVTGPKTTTVNQ